MEGNEVVLNLPITHAVRPRGRTEAQPVALDELDTHLIEALLEDGRKGKRALAAQLSVSEATVAVRLRRLVNQGVISFTTLIDWEAAGYEWFATLKVRVEGRSPTAVAEDIATLPGCIVSSVVFGEVDVLSYFLLANRSEIHQLIGERTGAIEGISSMHLDLASEAYFTSRGGASALTLRSGPVRLPRPRVPLDDIDVALLNHMLVDARQSSRHIARSMSVSEGTIRARMSRLMHAGLLRPVAMVNTTATGYTGVIANINIQVERDALRSTTSALLRMPGVVMATAIVGKVEIGVVLAVPDRSDLIDFVTSRVRHMPGVRATETLEMVEIVMFNPHFKRFAAHPNPVPSDISGSLT